MNQQKMTRRELLKALGFGAAAVSLAACAPAGPPSSSTGDSAASAPSTANKTMSIATYAIPFHDWQRHWAREWAAQHPDVDLEVLEIVYDEMPKKQLSMLATDSLWDVVYSGIKWFPYSAVSGAFLPLDDYIASTDGLDLSDFFTTALEGCKVDGVMYGLPYEMHPGNPALIVYNKTMLEEKGLDLPQDDWTVMDYADLAVQATDAENAIFGTQYLPGNYYDFANLVRSYGGEILGEDGTRFLFNDSPEGQEAARWVYSLRNELNCAPNMEESQGVQFAGGTLATSTLGLYAVLGLRETIADKFEYDFSLHPVGPEGQRGYSAFVSIFSAFSGTQYPDEAFDLINTLLSTEAGVWAVLNPPSYPNPRKSVWNDPKVVEQLPDIFMRALAMMSDDSIPGPFPMPNNVRFQELQDTWANTTPDLFYGESSFEDGMQFVQDECQAILDLPRPGIA